MPSRDDMDADGILDNPLAHPVNANTDLAARRAFWAARLPNSRYFPGCDAFEVIIPTGRQALVTEEIVEKSQELIPGTPLLRLSRVHVTTGIKLGVIFSCGDPENEWMKQELILTWRELLVFSKLAWQPGASNLEDFLLTGIGGLIRETRGNCLSQRAARHGVNGTH